ncbi:MAG: hypothetical protein PHV34_14550 [Verrucomicrobiae bacterium]|nr:hypothetical protein [Verrucomicrobiae bacterium]
MSRSIIPILVVIMLVALISAQCTITHRWPIGEVRIELIPPLLLYMAFTLNLPISLLLGLLAATLYDSFSGGPFGASLVPYIASVSLFCAVRPIFFRNRITTQLITGFLSAWITLILQWILSGKAMYSWHNVFPKLLRLSLLCSVLAVIYFTVLDAMARGMGQEPGRFNEDE